MIQFSSNWGNLKIESGGGGGSQIEKIGSSGSHERRKEETLCKLSLRSDTIKEKRFQLMILIYSQPLFKYKYESS